VTGYWFWVAVYVWIAWRWIGRALLLAPWDVVHAGDELLSFDPAEEDPGSGHQAECVRTSR
jgi:hypothetical protein